MIYFQHRRLFCPDFFTGILEFRKSVSGRFRMAEPLRGSGPDAGSRSQNPDFFTRILEL